MKLLNKDNIRKNQVNTIEQFKVLEYLKNQFYTEEVRLYLFDGFTIRLIDKNGDEGFFKYNSITKEIELY